MSIIGKKYIADTFDFDKNIVKFSGSGNSRGLYSVQPNGAHLFQVGSSAQVGTIKIAIGGTGTTIDDMLQFWVDIYDYASREMVTVKIGGYIYQGVGGNTWTNVQAMILAQIPSKNFVVRFGDDGTNHCVWIGEVADTWSHAQITVRDFSAGFIVGNVADVYTAPWTISFETTFGTVNNSLANNFPLASGGTSGGFLPLSAGSTFPLTGDLFVKAPGTGVDATTTTTFNMSVGGGNTNSYIAQVVPIAYDSLSSGTHSSLNFKVGTWNNNADAGISRMTILSNGNVGVGTTDPESYRLNVSGTGYYSGQLTVDGFINDSGISFRKGFTPTNTGIRAKAIGTANRDAVEILGYNGIDLTVNNGANVAMRINGVTGSGIGNVGIGTTSPTSKLEIGPNGSLGAVANKNVILNLDGGYATTGVGATGQYKVLGFVGTTRDVTDITAQTSGELLKNFFVGMIGGDYYNVNRFSVWQGGSERLTIQGYGTTAGNVGIGDTSPSYKLDVAGTIRATGDVIAYSDARVKDNVETIENALDKVTKLRGVSYTRNDVEDKTTKIGVIAQEVLEVLPEVVQQDDEGKYSVAYGNMVGLLIESIKELKAEVDELKSRL